MSVSNDIIHVTICLNAYLLQNNITATKQCQRTFKDKQRSQEVGQSRFNINSPEFFLSPVYSNFRATTLLETIHTS